MKFPILAFSALLMGCDPQLPSKVAAQSDELAETNKRLGMLEVNVSALEQTVQRQQQSGANWTLWQVSEALNAGYPQAFSAYPSKSECLTAADGWTYPAGTVVGHDPVIWQLKQGYRVRLECLLVGTVPYAH